MDSSTSFYATIPDTENLTGIIQRLSTCNTRIELFNAFESILAPLIKLDGIFIVSFNEQTSNADVFDNLEVIRSITPELFYLVKQIIFSNKNSPSTCASNFATSAIERFALEQPYNKIRLNEIARDIKAIAGIIDAPSPSIGLWIYRTDIKSAVFDEKEITILQNIRPYLMLAIKAVIFQEERSTYSSIIQNLLASSKPEAIIKYDGSIVVCNNKLTEQIRQVGLSALPFRLRLKIKSLIDGQLSPGNLQHDLAYYRLKRRLYAITLKPVEIKMNLPECTWLLTLTRLSNTTSLLIRTLNGANLTRRETEIVLCLQKGLSSVKIAEKLNLSYHTVRTHLKNIYKKLNISSVHELMAFLLKHSAN